MKITVNGSEYEYKGDGSLSGLLGELGASSKSVAVTVNEEIIRRSLHASSVLKEGDRVEVLTMAGGG